MVTACKQGSDWHGGCGGFTEGAGGRFRKDLGSSRVSHMKRVGTARLWGERLRQMHSVCKTQWRKTPWCLWGTASEAWKGSTRGCRSPERDRALVAQCCSHTWARNLTGLGFDFKLLSERSTTQTVWPWLYITEVYKREIYSWIEIKTWREHRTYCHLCVICNLRGAHQGPHTKISFQSLLTQCLNSCNWKIPSLLKLRFPNNQGLGKRRHLKKIVQTSSHLLLKYLFLFSLTSLPPSDAQGSPASL